MNKKLKLGLTITAVTLVALLIITTIVLACVPIKFSQFNNNMDTITVYKDGKYNSFVKNSVDQDSKDTFTALQKKFNNGVSESLLSSLFQGAFSEQAKEKITVETTTISSLTGQTGSTYVELIYAEDQTLKLNGQDYLTDSNRTVTYKNVLIEITNNSSLNQIKVYVKDKQLPTSASYTIKMLTKHSELYEYITDLYDDGRLF